MIATTAKTDPITHRYQLVRFSLGNATSFAPNMSGSTKFPSAAGIPGITKRNTMIAPCSVKNWL